MSPRIVNKKEKRKLIFDIALKLFAEKGYDHTTMDDIAEAAGIGKGTIYEYYESKNDFIKEAYRIYSRPNIDILKVIVNPFISPLEKLRKLMVMLVYEFQREQVVSKVIMNLWLEGSAKKIYPKIDLAKLYADTRKMADRLLQAAIKKGEIRNDLPKHTSAILLGMFEGITLQLMADPSLGTPEEIGNAIVDIITKGIEK